MSKDVRHSNAGKVVAGAVLAVLGSLMVCRRLVWEIAPPAAEGVLPHAMLLGASFWQDSVVIVALAAVGFAFGRLPGGWRAIGAAMVVALAAAILFVTFANVVAVHVVGTPLDSGWLSDTNPRDVGTSLPMIAASISQSMWALFRLIAIWVPLGAIGAAWLLGIRPGATLALALAVAIAACGSAWAHRTALASTDAQSRIINPLFVAARNAVFPSPARVFLYGEAGQASAAEARDWERKPSRPATFACCEGDDIVLITLDTVPLKSLDTALLPENAARFPNLHRLAKGGRLYRDFYAHFPMSAQSMGSFMTSLYPSTRPGLSTLEQTADRDLPVLSTILAQHGYRSAHLMSGQLKYGGARDFLRGRGFELIEDSDILNCGPDDAFNRDLYAHLGDACVAREAARWVGSVPPTAPMFLWAWFSNAHSPYYDGTPQPAAGSVGDRARHLAALALTDEAIGTVLDALEARGRLDRTIIALVADHGEAFGEHGHTNHGHSVFDEQVRVPLILFRPVAVKPGTENTLGGIIDLAPTLLDMIGVPIPAGWQGSSLFATERPKRVFFMSQRGERRIGYREGTRKYILSLSQGEPVVYDLQSDPNESRPLHLRGAEAVQVMKRIGAFVKNRNGLAWSPRFDEAAAGSE